MKRGWIVDRDGFIILDILPNEKWTDEEYWKRLTIKGVKIGSHKLIFPTRRQILKKEKCQKGYTCKISGRKVEYVNGREFLEKYPTEKPNGN